MRRWFNCGLARYVGLAKTHTQHLLEAIAYNLYRAPGIIVSNSKNRQKDASESLKMAKKRGMK
jgi:hypothetical protein